MADYLTAQKAADELQISVPTLYAYVSRGLIRSEETDGTKRTRRYNEEDVQRLKDRKEQRRSPEKAAEAVLNFGTPVLESGITLITDGNLYYRGIDADYLARERTFEEVAALIWTSDLESAINSDHKFSSRMIAVRQRLMDLPAFELFQILLPLAAMDDLSRYDLRPVAVMQTGARIMHLLAIIAAGLERFDGNIGQFLQQAWLTDQPQAARLIEAALILCADHELNVSAFTARCVASAGSTLYDVVSAGLAALHGSKHGGHTRRVEALFREIGTAENAHLVLLDRLGRGESIPGFGHPLYADGDPRGRLLLDMTAEVYPDSSVITLAETVADETFKLIGQRPTIDFALVTLANTLGLPPGTALAIFALGRTVGWIGHAIEQYAAASMIRPRARYSGSQPME